MLKHLIIAIVLVAIPTTLLAQIMDPSAMTELKRDDSQQIVGAPISTAAEARNLADRAFIEKMKYIGLDAMEGPRVMGIVQVGLDIPGFCIKGDKVWEIRMVLRLFSTSGLLWVHSQSGNVYFMAARWVVPRDEDNPTTYPAAKVTGKAADETLRIEGAAVAEQGKAKRLAFDRYIEKTQLSRSTPDDVKEISVTTLGYGIPGFAGRDERLWEARVMTPDNQLRSIVWINPHTEQVHFLIGPWVKDEPTSQTASRISRY